MPVRRPGSAAGLQAGGNAGRANASALFIECKP